MNIVYISKYASLYPYGIETRHVYLSRELLKRGHAVDLYISNSNHHLNNRPTNKSENYDGIQVKWIDTLNYVHAYGIKRILSWFHFEYKLRRVLKARSTKPDMVIVSSLSLLSILNGIWLKKKTGAKLIFEVRDIWPLVLSRLANISKSNPFYAWLRRVELKGYKNADVIMGTMPNLKEHVKESIAEQKEVLWVPHCVNPNLVYQDTQFPELDAIKQKYKKVICYAGTMNKTSGSDYFIDCAKRQEFSADYEMAFVLVGEGPMLQRLKDLQASENVFFINKLPQEQVVSFLKQCDFLYDGYMKSDVYRFGSSRNKYVEYSLAAKPMVVAYSGYPLFVAEYQCGIVIEPESADSLAEGILSLMKKEEQELQKMGENALNFASEKLSVSHQVNQLLEKVNV